MTVIDRSKPVLVTGATGFVASWLVKKLLNDGLIVHAAVRNPDDEIKNRHLIDLAKSSGGTIKFFKTNLLEKDSYFEAMRECELVFHTASPFTSNYSDAQTELLDPAIEGTINVLLTANKSEFVKRVVLTSSCAAIYSDCTDLAKTTNNIFTENDWNTGSSLHYQPYFYSKTMAERKAWEIVEAQNKWDLVVINPSLVLGPILNEKSSNSESFSIFKQICDGTLRLGVPNFGLGLVDVRDLAEAHFNAGFIPQASGRNIISGHNTNLLNIARILHYKYGNDYNIPKSSLPKWLLMLIGPLVDKQITRRFIANNINKIWKADNAKSIKNLKVSYRSIESTLFDTFNSIYGL